MHQVTLTSPTRNTRGRFNTRKEALEFQAERPDWTEDVPKCPKCGLNLVIENGSAHKCPHYQTFTLHTRVKAGCAALHDAGVEPLYSSSLSSNLILGEHKVKKRQETIEDILKRYSKLDPDTGCLLWIGPKANGYGRLRIPAKGKRSAHVLAWECIHGPLPNGFRIRRTCDNKLCIYTQHMVLFKNSSSGPEDDINWLLARLKKRITVNPITRCWEWKGPKDLRGYGKLRVKKHYVLAHRIMWECVYGDTQGLYVLHKCDNPCCVNPSHLFLGTHMDNMQDMTIKNRAARKLNSEAVRDIRTSKLSLKKLAEKYGVVVRTIYSVLSRETWKHIE